MILKYEIAFKDEEYETDIYISVDYSLETEHGYGEDADGNRGVNRQYINIKSLEIFRDEHLSENITTLIEEEYSEDLQKITEYAEEKIQDNI